MTTTGFFIRTALNNLRRGGQRVWVAVLCITFGVMSLVAMTLMARSTERVIIMPPDEKIGGDLLLYPADGGALSPEDIADLQQKQQDGVIDAYTLQAPTSTLIFHVPGSGNYRFVSNGIGIEPETYPLRGPLTISEPGNIGITSLLQEVGDVLVTVDLANSYDLKVGDTLILSTIDVGQTVAGKVRGVVSDTPNHAGGKLYYSIDTAKQLAGSEQVVQQAIATSPNPDAASQQFETSGWAAFTADALAGQFKDQDDLFSILFRGAGILGLMVGGIGIANTMQVLLRRRQREIAIWKTIGYSQADLRAMFVTEAAVMGVIGSLVGAALGIGISYQLLELLRRTGNMLLVWDIRPSLGTIAASMLIGVFTTIIFAMWAIVNASRVSPSGLLREEPIKAQQMPWFQGIFLMLALSVPFTIFTSYVMRSVTYGVGVLLFALAGLVVIGGFLAGLAWMVTHLLPVKHLPLVRMAQQNLHRRGRSLVFAMIALFAGVVTLAMGVMVTETAQREYEARDIDIEGYNLVIVAPWAQEKQIADALETTGVAKTVWGSRTEVSSIKVLGDVNQTDLDPVLVGRSTPYDYPVQGAEWGSQPDGVYTPFEAQAGAQVEVTLADGSTRAFPIVGSYNPNEVEITLPGEYGVLMPIDLATSLAEPVTALVYGEVAVRDVAKVTANLGTLLPDATVIDLLAYVSRFTETYHNLFALALSMAGLALLAGVLLVANSVSLAMLERRYEIGILKAIGYTRGHIQWVLVVEYGLVAAIACIVGVLAVQIFLMVLATANQIAGSLLYLTPLSVTLIAVLGISLVIVTVLGLTWRDTRISPIVVLNDRG